MQARSTLMVLSAMVLVTVCANDETIEINYGESISLSAVVGKIAHIGSEATTTNSIRNSHALAFIQGAIYMDYDAWKQGNVWSYGDTKFWSGTDVDFYSYSPMNMQNGNVSIEAEDDKKTANYSVLGDEDLLCASSQIEKKNEYESERPAMVNFRHTLSQIVFRIRSTSSNLTVFVDTVKVEGIEKQGTFLWPISSITAQW